MSYFSFKASKVVVILIALPFAFLHHKYSYGSYSLI
jgi:hypothetical protein